MRVVATEFHICEPTIALFIFQHPIPTVVCSSYVIIFREYYIINVHCAPAVFSALHIRCATLNFKIFNATSNDVKHFSRMSLNLENRLRE